MSIISGSPPTSSPVPAAATTQSVTFSGAKEPETIPESKKDGFFTRQKAAMKARRDRTWVKPLKACATFVKSMFQKVFQKAA